MRDAVTAPLDVRLMNMTATVLFLAFAILCVVAAARWIARITTPSPNTRPKKSHGNKAMR